MSIGKEIISEVIGVTKEAYRYLNGLSREQRGCKQLTDEQFDRLWRRCHKTKDDLKYIDDDSLGGGDGTYYGRWTSWSVDDIKKLLEDKGFSWVDLGTTQKIPVYI